MDKSWMNAHKVTKEFQAGVKAFIEYAKQFTNSDGEIHCPCKRCRNVHLHVPDIVYAHVHDAGMQPGYTTWTYHGESRKRARSNLVVEESGDDMGPIINDMIGNEAEEDLIDNDGDDNLTELLSKIHEDIYPGCKQSSTLKFTAELLHIKVLFKWSNESVDVLLKKLNEILPEGSNLPKTFYEAKRLLKKLGLGYQKIDVCEHDCALFWKENENLQACPICNTSRYKITKGKKVPHKVLRYFPLKPRLRRLYASRHTAKAMTWHRRGRSLDEDIMRHPVDGKEWNDFDRKYPDFGQEDRNVRLALATDGFNPFGNMSNSYSMWPVVSLILNTSPWDCYKDPYRHLTLLIPGPTSPGKDIDVYLQPLVEELQELWSEGIIVRDAATDTTFKMRAALMMTINDFPARSYLSGWIGQGYKACPKCNIDTPSQRLISKIGYVGHRIWLQVNHPMRKNKRFNGEIERRPPPIPKTEEEILQQLQKLEPRVPGKHKSYGGKKRKRPEYELNWTKRSSLWDLPYWPEKKLKYNLDVMHIEKNVFTNVSDTVLDIPGRTKDTDKARQDLKNMNVRSELHLYKQGNRVMKPHAAYTMSQENGKKFCEFLQGVRFPDGFASNLKKNVNESNTSGKLTGLKSHDCHVILQRLLPIGVRKFLRKDVADIIIDLSNFFRMLCSRTLKVSELEKAKEEVLKILCTMETIFPPAFFDIMVHLIMHLPEEAIRGGPVHLRWMYPVERFLGSLKKYIRNRARPEGSIAEAYMIDETLTFCSMYFTSIDTKFNRPDRNWVENEELSNHKISVFKAPFRSIGHMSVLRFDYSQRLKAEWYVLQNCTEIQNYLDEHRDKLTVSHSTRPLDEIHQQQFPQWFRTKMLALHHQEKSAMNQQLYSLASGPFVSVQSYPGCVINGVKFLTEKRDITRSTQNSGISVKGLEDHTYYGILQDIYVLTYPGDNYVVLFKCKWYDTSPRKKGVRVYKNRKSICTKNTWFDNEPFILASQAEQVFYVDDLHNGKDWKVVEHFRHRRILDTDDFNEEDVVHEETTHENFELFVEVPSSDSSNIRIDQPDIHATDVTPKGQTNLNESRVDDDDFINDEEYETDDAYASNAEDGVDPEIDDDLDDVQRNNMHSDDE